MPSVATFMMPAAKCVTAVPEDKLSSVVESLVKERIGCVVVVDPSDNTAVGIVTKQDVNRLFLKLTPLDTPVKDVMSTTLHPGSPEMTRDEAADLLQRHRIHHAVVNTVEGTFAGLFSSWDIARECALDAKAWPYNRGGFSKFDGRSRE